LLAFADLTKIWHFDNGWIAGVIDLQQLVTPL